MRKVLVIFVVLAVLLASNAIGAQRTQRPSSINDIAVTLINQEPDPVEPGRYVDVRFKFDNNGSGEARNVMVELLPEYPFSLEPGKSTTRNIGTLQSRQRGDVGVIVKYRLIVDKNAIEGDNEIKIRYKEEGYDWIEPEEFFVEVRTSDAILSIDSVKVDTTTLKPGKSGTITISVSNKGDSLLSDIKANLGISSVPIVPIGSSNEKSAYQIGSRSSYDFMFDVMTEPEAAAGVYKVPLRITYSDTAGNTRSTNGTIGLIVGAKPDLSITLDTTEVYENKKPGDIAIKVVNKGVTDIKFANVRLMASKDYRILSNDEDYLGNIDSDDYETAEFKIYVENKKDKKIILPVSIEYMDANNNEYKTEMNIEMPLYSTSEAKRFGLIDGNGTVGFFIAVLIVAAGLFAYRRWKRSRKK